VNKGKYIDEWRYSLLYFTEPFLAIVFLGVGIFLILISFLTFDLKTGAFKLIQINPNMAVFGFILILLFIYFGIFRPELGSKKIKGSNIIRAKLYENYFLGYNAPFGLPNVKVDFRDKPTLLLIKLKYLTTGKSFIETTNPWAGWAMLFLSREVIWGPNISLVRLNIKEHNFIYETIKQAKNQGCKVSYISLDPQYLDLYLLKLRELLKTHRPEKALKKLSLTEEGTLNEEVKGFVQPKHLPNKASIPPTYEEAYETFRHATVAQQEERLIRNQ
jgi:hypothetical protein